jgi:uncharacterized protein YrrD
VVKLFPVSPLESVREGMSVVDAQNHRVGRVAAVFQGNPSAVSTNEDELPGGLVGMIIVPLENTGGTSSVGTGYPYIVDRILDDPEIPDELRLELVRGGFIEVDGPGLSGAARYIHGDQIASVSDDEVRLKTVHTSRAGHPKPTAPRVALGATVKSADGQEVGKVDRLIVDPYTLAIRAMVVRKGLILPHAVEIPLVAIQESSGNQVRLRYTADQVSQLPEFVEAHYAAPPTGFVPPAAYTRDSLLWPLGVSLLPPPPPRRNETAVRWYGNNAEIGEGSEVVARDGTKIGEVHAVLLDPATRRPTSFVVRRGFLFSHEVELPVDAVRDVGEGVVYVDLDSAEARAYAQARPSLRTAKAQSE